MLYHALKVWFSVYIILTTIPLIQLELEKLKLATAKIITKTEFLYIIFKHYLMKNKHHSLERHGQEAINVYYLYFVSNYNQINKY